MNLVLVAKSWVWDVKSTFFGVVTVMGCIVAVVMVVAAYSSRIGGEGGVENEEEKGKERRRTKDRKQARGTLDIFQKLEHTHITADPTWCGSSPHVYAWPIKNRANLSIREVNLL